MQAAARQPHLAANAAKGGTHASASRTQGLRLLIFGKGGGVSQASIRGTCTHDVRLAQLCSRCGVTHPWLSGWVYLDLHLPGLAPAQSSQAARSGFWRKWPALALHIAMSHVKRKHISVWKWWAPGMARELECVICPGPGPDGAHTCLTPNRGLKASLPRSSRVCKSQKWKEMKD